MKKAEYISSFSLMNEGVIECTLCPRRCRINDRRVGVCGVRGVKNGNLIALNYGRLIAIHNDPIEKKPLFHFLPGSKSLSIATIGCNLFCQNCQNYSISQQRLSGIDEAIFGDYYSPEEIIEIARKNNSKSISYTYTEPTIFAEYAFDIIKNSKDLKHVFVTNGYMSDELIDKLLKNLNAANIDLKSFSDEFYKKVCKARLNPVLNTIKRFFEAGIHIEITTLLIPNLNDSEDELKKVAEFLSSISPDIPWHISRYHPDYKLNLPSTPLEKIERAREIGIGAGLRYVYSGNVWGDEGENTFCYNCKRMIVEREGFTVRRYEIVNGKCRYCNTSIYGLFE